jgi:hypothetical protein
LMCGHGNVHYPLRVFLQKPVSHTNDPRSDTIIRVSIGGVGGKGKGHKRGELAPLLKV